MTVRAHASRADAGGRLAVFERLAPAPAARPPRRAHRRPHRPRRRRRRPGRSRRLGGPRRGRSPAPRRLDRIDPADPDARGGRAATAGRPSPRRRVPGHVGVAPWRVEPQGVDGRPVRDALRDVRAGPRRRRVHLVRRRRRAGPTDHAALPLHGLPRHARRIRGPPRRARGGGPRAGHERCRCRCRAVVGARPVPGGRRRAGPRGRAARPAHAPPARGARRRSWNASRRTSVRRPCSPRCASRCSTRSSRRAGSRPASAGAGRCASPAATSACRRRPTGGSATRGSPSRRRSARSAGSSSTSRAARWDRSRPGSARTSGRWPRARRPRCWPWPAPRRSAR